MAFKKNTLIGLIDGLGVGIYLPGYIAKKISGKNFYSHGEAINKGRLTDKDVDRTSLEYKLMKGTGNVLGVAFGLSNLYLIGIIYDIMQNKNLKKLQDYYHLNN